MFNKLRRVTGPIAIAVALGCFALGMILYHIAQPSASSAWYAIIGSVGINVAVNVVMTKWNRASGELADGPLSKGTQHPL